MDSMKELSPGEMEGIFGGSGGSRTPLPPRSGCKVYQIREGDTLGLIARRYHTTTEHLKSLNVTIRNIHDITPGYYIYVPE